MNEKKRLSLRAKMLSWNKGHKCMEAALEEFGKDESALNVASAVIGGSCAALLEKGYDHLTIKSLLWAQVAIENLWQHAARSFWEPKHKPKRKQ
jgi:hypothetical protein